MNKKEKCIDQDRSQKETGLQRAAVAEKRQKVFCDKYDNTKWYHGRFRLCYPKG